MKGTSQEHIITRKKLEEAVNAFIQNGGKIKVLPPQVLGQSHLEIQPLFDGLIVE